MPERDPRRPDRICVPKRVVLKEDDYPIQWFAILSLLCGMGSIFFRHKLFGWVACFCCAGHLSTLRFSQIDLRQLLAAVMFSIMSLVVNYGITLRG